MGIDDLWGEIQLRWGSILEIFRRELPVNDFKMYNDIGELVDSNRPMLESIVSDFTIKSQRFFYYLLEAGIVKSNTHVQNVNGRREISVHVSNSIGFTTGGKVS